MEQLNRNSPTYDFLLMFHSNHGPTITKISHPRVLQVWSYNYPETFHIQMPEISFDHSQD